VTMPAPPIPALEQILARPRRLALDAFARGGWRPYATPIRLDAERRRLLNLDLGDDPDLAFAVDGDLAAVARVEADRAGVATHGEVVATEPAEPTLLAHALLGEGAGEPRMGGGADAREWIWGPESGLEETVGGEPVRLWICAERQDGDRLWMVASVVRRG